MTREQAAVFDLLKKYKTSNPFELCEILKIKVNYSYLKTLRGFYRYSSRNHFIEINYDLEHAEKYLTCAHELGHYILHQGLNGIFLSTTLMLPNKYEIQADRFAGYLLLEYYKSVNEIPDRYLKLMDSDSLKKYIKL